MDLLFFASENGLVDLVLCFMAVCRFEELGIFMLGKYLDVCL